MLELVGELRQALSTGSREGAERAVARLLDVAGADTQVRSVCGAALLYIGEMQRALDVLPQDAHLLRAKALQGLGRLPEALQACEMTRHDDGAERVRSEILSALKRQGKAVAPGARAAADVAAVVALKQRMALLLAAGKVREAFGLFADAERGDRVERIGLEDCPRWTGEPVRRLLVIGLAGLGDALQFLRYLPAVRARCEHLTLYVDPALASIARRIPGVDEVVTSGLHAEIQRADAHASLFVGLPLALGQEFGDPSPYVQALPERVPSLDPAQAHVGLCWAASAYGSDRSIPASLLARLQALPGVAFHCLQVGAAEAHAGAWVRRWTLRDFEDTAGLIAALDVVVSVDTAVAHLAGAMGKPVHLVLSQLEDWRWGAGERTGWYPTMRIYRGNVAASVARIADALTAGA